MKSLFKRTIMLILVIAMLLGIILPMTVLADGELSEEDLIAFAGSTELTGLGQLGGTMIVDKTKCEEINLTVENGKLYVNGKEFSLNIEAIVAGTEDKSYFGTLSEVEDYGEQIGLTFTLDNQNVDARSGIADREISLEFC